MKFVYVDSNSSDTINVVSKLNQDYSSNIKFLPQKTDTIRTFKKLFNKLKYDSCISSIWDCSELNQKELIELEELATMRHTGLFVTSPPKPYCKNWKPVIKVGEKEFQFFIPRQDYAVNKFLKAFSSWEEEAEEFFEERFTEMTFTPLEDSFPGEFLVWNTCVTSPVETVHELLVYLANQKGKYPVRNLYVSIEYEDQIHCIARIQNVINDIQLKCDLIEYDTKFRNLPVGRITCKRDYGDEEYVYFRVESKKL